MPAVRARARLSWIVVRAARRSAAGGSAKSAVREVAGTQQLADLSVRSDRIEAIGNDGDRWVARAVVAPKPWSLLGNKGLVMIATRSKMTLVERKLS